MLLPIKVNVESRYCYAIFFIVHICTTIFECNIDPCSVPDPFFAFLSDVYKKTLTPLLTQIFYNIYIDAYKTDNAENYIRHKFYEMSNLFISLVIPMFQNLSSKIDNAKVGELIDIEQILRDFNNVQWELEMNKYQTKIKKRTTPMQFVSRSGLEYGKSINDKHLNALLSGLKNSLIKTIKNTTIPEYLYRIISNCVSSGGSFRKNDINDALVLSNIDANNIILSFDKGVISYLENATDKHPEYNNSLQYIKSFYK